MSSRDQKEGRVGHIYSHFTDEGIETDPKLGDMPRAKCGSKVHELNLHAILRGGKEPKCPL